MMAPIVNKTNNQALEDVIYLLGRRLYGDATLFDDFVDMMRVLYLSRMAEDTSHIANRILVTMINGSVNRTKQIISYHDDTGKFEIADDLDPLCVRAVSTQYGLRQYSKLDNDLPPPVPGV
jgi:hypothetical protein